MTGKGSASIIAFAFVLGISLQAVAQSITITTTAPSTTRAGTTQPAADLKPAIAHMRFAGVIMDSPPEFSLFGDNTKQKTLTDWLTRLAKARDDAKVQAVALELDSVSLSWSQAQELAESIRRIDKVKPVYAYITTGNVSQYTLAAAARQVAMEPSGDLDIRGLAGELMYFKNTLKMIGVQPQMVQVGKFKGAAEPFANDKPSEEFLGEMNKVFDDLFDQMVSQISEARKLDKAAVKAAIDEGPFTGADALRLKLVDKLMEKDDWKDYVGKLVAPKDGLYTWRLDYGKEKAEAPDISNPFAMLAAMMKERGETVKSPTVAVVHAEGMITGGSSGSGLLGQKMVGAKSIVKAFNEAAADDRIKAIVLRIDSPGGSALASELMYQAIRNAGKKKPVVVSIAGMAASGGYYIAVGAPTIYADPTALVGSIGVVSGKMAIQETLEKLGITTFAITRGKNAGLELSRPWTPEELAVVTRQATTVYDQFAKRVSDSRGKKIGKIEDVAQGRIFTARQGLANGMVDNIGGLREAIQAARKKAGLETSNLISLPKPKTFADILFGEDEDDDQTLAPLKVSVESQILNQFLHNRGAIYLLNLANGMQKQTMFMAMPFYVDVR